MAPILPGGRADVSIESVSECDASAMGLGLLRRDEQSRRGDSNP
jgi:hypothetical protein